MPRVAAVASVLIVLALMFAFPVRAESETEREVRALYERLVAAQNARDVAAVRSVLWESPRFLWISDGKPFWGPDAMIARMSAFQRAEIWEVTPARERARVVEVSPTSAVLFQPLRLTLGPRTDARSIDFLVNMLAIRTADGWRVAALYTTDENPN
jgi:hypothetical protein